VIVMRNSIFWDIRGQVNKYAHTIFIIYFNNGRALTIISFFNIVPVLFNTLVSAFHELLDARRNKVFG
jgi:hypothetical protein